MLLSGTVKEDINDIARSFKCKKSTECDGIDMDLVKGVNECIVEPFTYICNLPLHNRFFLEKMKIATSLPICEAGDVNSSI